MIARYKALPMSQRVTLFATFIMLALRMTESFWPRLIFGKALEDLDSPIQWLYITFTFISFFALIILNKENLQDLFIDKLFVVICILDAALYALYYSGTIIWIVIVVATLILFEFLRGGKLKFSKTSPFMLGLPWSWR